MKDVLVEIWNNQKTINFEEYGTDPTYTTNYMYDLYLLDPIKSRLNYVYISKHNFQNLDGYHIFAEYTSGAFYQIERLLLRPGA